MDFDDLLSVPVVTTARVGRKFQPKRKPSARKIPTGNTETTDQQARPASTSSDQANDRSVEQLDASNSTAVTSVDVTGTEKPSRSNEDSIVEDLCDYNTSVLAPEHYGSGPPTCDTSNCGGDYSYNVVQSTEENAGISSNICYDDENDRSTTIAENAEDNHVQRNIPLGASPSTDGANALHLETSSEEDHASFQYVISEDNDVLFDTENLEYEFVGAVASSGLLDIACEVSAISGKRAVHFHPKPKLCGKWTDYEAGSVPLPSDTSTVPSEGNPFPQRPHDPDFPPQSFDGTFPIDLSEDCVLNTNQNQVSEESHGASQPDDAVSDDVADLESVPNVADLEDVENITSQSYQDEGFVSTAGEGNETGNYSSKLRKRKVAQEFVSGMDTIASDAEGSMDSPLDEDVGADENYQFGQVEEGTSRNKGSRPRSTTDATGNNKPARKRKKKKAEACEQSDKQPYKRLPHSTRRKKRMVDKSFLETPDDEIEFHTVPLRDLIIRAEIKQRQAKKASTAVNPPTTKERSNSTMQDNPYDDDHAFASEPGMSTEDNMSAPNVKVHNADYYNYHTYMEKKSTKRWSKQETELFYKAVSQFGSDFSMIEQLFDGRSRQQIKSKYKKEERQNPMRLLDALTYKAKDFSHFERALYAAEKSMSRSTQQDGAADMAGDEDAVDSHPETDADTPMEEATPPEGADFAQASVDETEKSDEQKEESAAADEVPEEYYTGSPAEDDDIDGLFCDYNG